MANEEEEAVDETVRLSEVEVTQLREIAGMFLVREIQKPDDKAPNPHSISRTVTENDMIGVMENAGTTWRLVGMRAARYDAAGCNTDYDVYRVPSVWKVEDKEITEVLTDSKREQILRLCRYDAPADHTSFMNEYYILSAIREQLVFKDALDLFPTLFALGKLKELRYMDNKSGRKTVPLSLPIPRPFYIVEKIEPTIETLMRSTRNKTLNISTSTYLIFGCIRALRALHHLGYCHRNIQPSSFGLRLGPTGKLHRREGELVQKVALLNFSLCRKYRNLKKTEYKHLKKWPHFGTLRYSSPGVMRGEEATSVDDLISLAYMFLEMISGKLDWEEMDPNNLENIIKSKIKTENEMVNVKQEGSSKAVYKGFNEIFTIIRQANGYDRQIDYEGLCHRIAKGAEDSADIEEVSLFGFQHSVINTYRNGFRYSERKTADMEEKPTSVAEKEAIKAKANQLFLVTRRRKEEKEGDKTGCMTVENNNDEDKKKKKGKSKDEKKKKHKDKKKKKDKDDKNKSDEE